MLRPADPTLAQAFVTAVLGAGEVSDRLAARDVVTADPPASARRGGFARVGLHEVSRRSARRRYALTNYEFQLYGILRAKHGMSKRCALEAILRSRRATPHTQGEG